MSPSFFGECMNKYLDYYQRDRLEKIDFSKRANKALKYGIGAILLSVIGCFLGPIAQLNDYSFDNFFFGFLIGLLVFFICFSSFRKLKKLEKAKSNIVAHIDEIENKLFDNLAIPSDQVLIGINEKNELFILGKNSIDEFFTFIASDKFLHFSPVIMSEKEKDYFISLITGSQNFYVLKESL